MNLGIALSDRGANHLLNTFRLKPWLSVVEVVSEGEYGLADEESRLFHSRRS